MFESHCEMQDITKNGRFTSRNLSDIHEEKFKRNSTSTIDLEPSTPSSQRDSPGSRKHIPREGDVMLMPLNLGIEGLEPDFYLTAAPSIVTYTVGRGYSSVQMEEIDLPHIDLQGIEEMESPLGIRTETLRDKSGFPIIPPPKNFQPVHASGIESRYPSETMSPSQHVRAISPLPQVSQSSRSIHTMGSDKDDLNINSSATGVFTPPSNLISQDTTLKPLPLLPKPDFLQVIKQPEMPYSGAAWPLLNTIKHTPHAIPPDPSYSLHSDHSAAATTLRNSGEKELQDLKSRFSWYDANEKRRSWVQRWVHDWWLFELTCLFLSALFIAIICAIGVRYDGTEIPQSWAFGITLNALISVLAAFSRISLFFPTAEVLGQLKWHFSAKGRKRTEDFEINDEDKGGPMESIKLLARTKRITWGASIGAMLLLALPMDFFFQQLVHYPTVWLPAVSGSGTMSRSVNYSPELFTSTVNNTVTLIPEPTLEISLFPFVIGHGQDIPIDFDCATNNCTFESFWTLALQSDCVEMTAFLRPGCETGPAEWTPSASTVPDQNGTYVNGTSCGWYVEGINPVGPGTLPILMSGYATSNGSKQEALVERMYPMRDIFTKKLTLGDSESFNFRNIQYPVMDFIVSSTPGGIAGAYNNNTPVLHECVVYWTTQKMNVAIFEGKITQTVLDTQLLNYSGNPGLTAYSQAGKFTGNYSMPLQDLGKTTVFTVDNYAARRTSMVLGEIAASAWYAVNDTSPLQVKWLWLGLPPKITPAPSGSDGWMLYAGSGLSDYLARVVSSFNHVIWKTENVQKQKTDAVSGQAWRQAVIIRATWTWIAAPAALLLFSIIFIVATIVQNCGRRGELGVWRTAALTVKVRKRQQKRRF